MGGTMSDRVVVERFVEEVMNAGNLDAADGLIDPDHVNHASRHPRWVAVLRG
jgi:hypothetical protein